MLQLSVFFSRFVTFFCVGWNCFYGHIFGFLRAGKSGCLVWEGVERLKDFIGLLFGHFVAGEMYFDSESGTRLPCRLWKAMKICYLTLWQTFTLLVEIFHKNQML